MKPILVREKRNLNASIEIDGSEYNYFYNPWHYHPELELTLILKSYGQRQVGDSIERFGPGDLVLVGANLPHVWKNDPLYFDDATMTAQAIVLKFLPTFTGTGFLERPEMAGIRKVIFDLSPFGIKLKGGLKTQVTETMMNLPQLDETDRFLGLLHILNLISKSDDYNLLASISYRNGKTADNHRINKVLDHIMDHYQEELCLDDFARLTGMNRNAFCRFFKKATRRPLFEMINEARLGKACQLLKETDMNVLQVCYASGFREISGFNKAFKRKKGISPLQYRKLFYQD